MLGNSKTNLQYMTPFYIFQILYGVQTVRDRILKQFPECHRFQCTVSEKQVLRQQGKQRKNQSNQISYADLSYGQVYIRLTSIAYFIVTLSL